MVKLIIEKGTKHWSSIASELNTNRTGKQVSLPWTSLHLTSFWLQALWNQNIELSSIAIQYRKSWVPSRRLLVNTIWLISHIHDLFFSCFKCRERWHNQLDPHICKITWTDEEDLVLVQVKTNFIACDITDLFSHFLLITPPWEDKWNYEIS